MRAYTEQHRRLLPLERSTARLSRSECLRGMRLLYPRRLSKTRLLPPKRSSRTEATKARLSCPGWPMGAVHDWSISSLRLALSVFRITLIPKTRPQLAWNHIDVDSFDLKSPISILMQKKWGRGRRVHYPHRIHHGNRGRVCEASANGRNNARARAA